MALAPIKRVVDWITTNPSDRIADIRVLLAEDDQTLACMVQRTLEPLGIHCMLAPTVAAGREMMKGADILFLDLTLLNGSAQPLLSEWVKAGPKPICILSGGITQDQIEDYLGMGAWNVLLKPFRLETIHVLMHRYTTVVRQRLLAQEVYAIKKWVILLALIVVGLIGKDVLPYLAGLF